MAVLEPERPAGHSSMRPPRKYQLWLKKVNVGKNRSAVIEVIKFYTSLTDSDAVRAYEAGVDELRSLLLESSSMSKVDEAYRALENWGLVMEKVSE